MIHIFITKITASFYFGFSQPKNPFRHRANNSPTVRFSQPFPTPTPVEVSRNRLIVRLSIGHHLRCRCKLISSSFGCGIWDKHKEPLAKKMNVSKNRCTPKWMVYMENPTKMDDWVVPLFLETPKCSCIVGIFFMPQKMRCSNTFWYI